MIYSIRFRRRGVGNSKQIVFIGNARGSKSSALPLEKLQHLPAVVSDPSHNPCLCGWLERPGKLNIYSANKSAHARWSAWCLEVLGRSLHVKCEPKFPVSRWWLRNSSTKTWSTKTSLPSSPHTQRKGLLPLTHFCWKNLTFVSKLRGNPYFLPPRKIGLPHALRGKETLTNKNKQSPASYLRMSHWDI